MHDSSHTAFGHKQAWYGTAGRLFMDFYAGANMTSWHYQVRCRLGEMLCIPDDTRRIMARAPKWMLARLQCLARKCRLAVG